MRTTSARRRPWARQHPAPIHSERGALLMFVLLVMLLIAAITLTVMQFIAADQAAGIHEMQAVQVFNVAESGVHFAIGQLQQSGATNYNGQTITVTSGSTTLGTATITVNCIDTGAAPPCSGTWANYRRIISVGTLPASSATRTVVAVVQGTQGTTYGICTGSTMTFDSDILIHSNIGSNGSISLGSGDHVYADTSSPPAYTGLARAVGTISCADGCGTQVAGGATPNAPSPVCPSVTLPTFSPGSTNLTVPSSGFTLDGSSGHGYTWGNVTVSSGGCPPYTDLKIQADPSNPNAVTVVNMNSLFMNPCSRLMILGVGKVDLRIASTGTDALFTDSDVHFGVLSGDTQASPKPVPASQLTVSLRSSDSQAIDLSSSAIIAGAFIAPNGGILVDSLASPGNIYGSFQSNLVTINRSGTFYSDTSGFQGATSSFNNLRSWKDQ